MSKNMEKDDKMKKFGTKLLAAVIASSLVATPVMAAPSINEIKENKAAAQNEAASLRTQLKEVIQEISEIEEELIKTGEEIIKTTENLKKAEKTEQKQYEDMKLRIKFMYEKGDDSMLETLISSENFTDLMNKAEYVQNVHTYDREKLNEYVATKKKVAKLKKNLEKEQKALETKSEQFEEKEASLNDMLTSKEAEVANLDAELQAAVEEAAREEAARREAEERARREREERANAERNNNNDTDRNDNGNGNNDSDAGNNDDGGKSNEKEYNSYVGGSAVSRARSKLGCPYVYGAVGPNSFDCSGLVGFALTGRYRRSYTSGSFLGMPRVSDPKPGDVCVRPGHVGIYIGGGQMIHAPHTGDVVKISPVQSGMWYVRP